MTITAMVQAGASALAEAEVKRVEAAALLKRRVAAMDAIWQHSNLHFSFALGCCRLGQVHWQKQR